MELMIFTKCGQRKYLTSNEVSQFTQAARKLPLDVRSFCLTIAYTGCRISEALALTAANIDFEAQALIVKCLKKRGKTVYRGIPLPAVLLEMLRCLVRQIDDPERRLWPWSRMTGYRRIRDVMDSAGIVGEHATPKGLRHGFAVQAIQANVPLTLVQRWLGHADIKTTAIYTSAMGAEERSLAARMWREEKPDADATTPAPKEQAKPSKPAEQKAPANPRPATAYKAAVHYRLHYPTEVGQPIPAAPIGPESSRKAAASAGGVPKKNLLRQLRDCTLVQFWLNRNSKNTFNSHT